MEQVISSIQVIQVFENDYVLQNILSYVGEYQYRYIASVNRLFHTAYTTLYPYKVTYCNGSSMKHTIFCYNEIPIDDQYSLFQAAAIHGNIDGLQYLLDRHFTLTVSEWRYEPTLICVIQNGHFDVLKWMHLNDIIISDTNHEMIQLQAIQFGNIKIVEWIRSISTKRRLPSTACMYAARCGQLHMLQWLREQGCPLYDDTSLYATKYGHLHVLQWLHENGCPLYEHICTWAAKYGHLDVVQWAHEHGYPWDAETCQLAAWKGHLHVLQWLREHGCPWDEKTCSNAATEGHLHVLQWAHEHGCPWDKYTCFYADISDHLHVLKWALEHGCPPWDRYA
jgi:hypothetical protein